MDSRVASVPSPLLASQVFLVEPHRFFRVNPEPERSLSQVLERDSTLPNTVLPAVADLSDGLEKRPHSGFVVENLMVLEGHKTLIANRPGIIWGQR